MSDRTEHLSRLVFVLGTGRCGSTITEELLARHEDIGFVSNVEDNIGALDGRDRFNNALYRRVPAALTAKGRLRFAPSEAYQSLSREVSPALVDPTRDLTADDLTPWLEQRLRRYFERRIESQGQPVFIHKLTGWPRIGLLRAAFPDARFIHVVRDGRAVASSWLQMSWWRGHLGPEGWHFGPLPAAYQQEWEASGRSPVLLAGLAWKVLLDAFELAADELADDHYREVRFEDVVTSPREVLTDLLDFAGLEWSPQFERGFARTSLSPARLRSFEAELTREQLDMLTRSLKVHLERHGYDR